MPSAPDQNAIAYTYDASGSQLGSLHLQTDSAYPLSIVFGADFDASGRLWVGDQDGVDPSYIPALLRINTADGSIVQRLQLPSDAARFYMEDVSWSGTHMVIAQATTTTKTLTWVDLSTGSEFRSTSTALPSAPFEGKTPQRWELGVAMVSGGPFVPMRNSDGSCTLVGLDAVTGAVTEASLLADPYVPEGMDYDPARNAIVMYVPGTFGTNNKIVTVDLAIGATLSVWDAPDNFSGSGVALFP